MKLIVIPTQTLMIYTYIYTDIQETKTQDLAFDDRKCCLQLELASLTYMGLIVWGVNEVKRPGKGWQWDIATSGASVLPCYIQYTIHYH